MNINISTSLKGIAVAFACLGSTPIKAEDDATLRMEFNSADKNRDGTVTFEEYRQFKTSNDGEMSQTPANAKGFKRVPRKPEEPSKDDVITTSVAKYLDIHKSFLSGVDSDANDPAKFNWTSPHGKDSTYTVDLAVQLDADHRLEPKFPIPLAGYNWLPTLNAVFEAHTSTVADSATNQLLYQAAFELHGSRQPPAFPPERSKGVIAFPERSDAFVQGHHLFIRPGYETNRRTSLKQRRLDIDYTPDLSLPFYGATRPLNELRLGSEQPFAKLSDNWEFYWRPIIGLELHSIEDGFEVLTKDSHLPDLDEEYGFLRFHLQAELRMFDRFTLTGTWQHRTEIAGNAGSHNYLEVALIWNLDPERHYSVGASYKRGEDSPVFDDLNVFEAWVGLDF